MGVLDDLDAQSGQPAPAPAASAPPAAPAEPKRHSVLDDLDTSAPPATAATDSGVGTGEDMLRSGISSVPKGLMAGAGAVGDIRGMVSQATDYVGSKFGASQEGIDKFKSAVGQGSKYLPAQFGALAEVAKRAPTTPQIRSAVEKKLGVEFYDPQTRAGKYTGAIGETLANPLTYVGSGGLLLKTMMGAGAGAGAEGGHELGESFGLETPGSIAGSVAGSLLARRVGSTRAPTAPTRAALRDAADQQYEAARNFGVTIDPASTDQLARDIGRHLWDDRGFRNMKDLGRQTFSVLDELRDQNRPHYNVDDIKSVRTALGNVAKSHSIANTPERAAAIEAINMIDDYMVRLSPHDVLANAHALPQLRQTMTNARGNYAAAMRSTTLEDMADRATRQAARSGSGTNIDNATRQRVDSIINNPKKRMQYSTQELDAMREIVNGTFARNLGRYTGKMSPSGIVSATLGTKLGQAVAGKAGAALGPAVGYVTKKLADDATTRALSRLNEATRARSPLYGRPYRPQVRPSVLPAVYSSIAGRQEPE